MTTGRRCAAIGFTFLPANPAGTLYVGVTNNIFGRVEMHKAGKGSAFTSKYRVTMLVYIEQFADIRLAF